MSIEKIKSRIAADARKEGEEILAVAKKDAEEIVQKIHAQAADITEQLTQKGKDEAVARKERQIGVAALESRKRKLAAKQAMIGKAFENAATDISNLPQSELVSLLSKLASQASRTGKEKIVLTSSDHQRFGVSVAEGANNLLNSQGKIGNLTLSDSPRELVGGGLMLSDGDVEINATFSAIISSLKAEMSAEVAKVLFN